MISKVIFRNVPSMDSGAGHHDEDDMDDEEDDDNLYPIPLTTKHRVAATNSSGGNNDDGSPQRPPSGSSNLPNGDSGNRHASSTFNPRTAPNCVRCRNHNLKNLVKGHKHYCLYSDCVCDKCQHTSARQKDMAQQTAYRRALQLHQTKVLKLKLLREEAKLHGKELSQLPVERCSPIMSPKLKATMPSTTTPKPLNDGSCTNSEITELNSPASSVTNHSDAGLLYLSSKDSKKSRASSSSSVNNALLAADEAPLPSTPKTDLKSALKELQELIKSQDYNLEITTLLYLVVKETPDPQKAFERIVEAQMELSSKLSVTNENSNDSSSNNNNTTFPGCPGVSEEDPSTMEKDTRRLLPVHPPITHPMDTAGLLYLPPHSVLPGTPAFPTGILHHPLGYPPPYFHHQYHPITGLRSSTDLAAAALHATAFPLTGGCRIPPYPRRHSSHYSPPSYLACSYFSDDENTSRMNMESLLSNNEQPTTVMTHNHCVRDRSPGYPATSSPSYDIGKLPLNLTK